MPSAAYIAATREQIQADGGCELPDGKREAGGFERRDGRAQLAIGVRHGGPVVWAGFAAGGISGTVEAGTPAVALGGGRIGIESRDGGRVKGCELAGGHLAGGFPALGLDAAEAKGGGALMRGAPSPASRSLTSSLGRHRRARLPARPSTSTIGRLMRMGLAASASSSSSWSTSFSSRPSSRNRGSRRRTTSRTEMSMRAKKRDQIGARQGRCQIFDDARLVTGGADIGERVARRAATGIVIDRDLHGCASFKGACDVARAIAAARCAGGEGDSLRRITPPPAFAGALAQIAQTADMLSHIAGARTLLRRRKSDGIKIQRNKLWAVTTDMGTAERRFNPYARSIRLFAANVLSGANAAGLAGRGHLIGNRARAGIVILHLDRHSGLKPAQDPRRTRPGTTARRRRSLTCRD